MADYLDTAVRRVVDTVNGPGVPTEKRFSANQVLGHVQAGQREFVNKLIAAGVNRVLTYAEASLQASQSILVPGDHFREPINVWERANGITGDWCFMVHQPIPMNAPVVEMRYWWDYHQQYDPNPPPGPNLGGQMIFNTATRATLIKMEYFLDLADLKMPYSQFELKGSIDAISHFATALALMSSPGRAGDAAVFFNLAEQETDTWIQQEVHVMQQNPQRQLRPNYMNPLFNYWV